jgi:hypothetical protein
MCWFIFFCVILSEYRDAVAKMKLIVDNSKYNSDPEGGSSRRERKTLNRYAADDFNTKRRRETANSQACDNDGVEKGSESDSDSDIARKLAIDVKVNFADLGMSNADSTWFDTGK